MKGAKRLRTYGTYNKIAFNRRLRQSVVNGFTEIEKPFIDIVSSNELFKIFNISDRHGN